MSLGSGSAALRLPLHVHHRHRDMTLIKITQWLCRRQNLKRSFDGDELNLKKIENKNFSLKTKQKTKSAYNRQMQRIPADAEQSSTVAHRQIAATQSQLQSLRITHGKCKYFPDLIC